MSEQRPPEAQNSGELEHLMQGYQRSETEAAETLITQLSPPMFHFYLAQVRDRSLSEDLLQEFWLRIHNARHTYRLGEPLLPWMYAIARRVRIDHYRRSRSERQHEIQSEYPPDRAAEDTRPADSGDLADLLRTIPATQRDVILLMKVSGLTLEEVAGATGSSVGAVKQKAHRGYENLRKLFGSRT